MLIFFDFSGVLKLSDFLLDALGHALPFTFIRDIELLLTDKLIQKIYYSVGVHLIMYFTTFPKVSPKHVKS